MNKERILELANIIEKQPHRKAFRYRKENDEKGFNMLNYNHCGTPSCIAGWASFIYDPEVFAEACEISAKSAGMLASMHATMFFNSAMNALDISDDVAQNLFIPEVDALENIKPKKAAKVLRCLAETGEVKW